MLSVQSATLDVRQHSEYEIHQLYCGLDNALTHESLQREFELFESNTNPRPQAKYIYDFERALQAPYLDVMLRGFRVDVEAREAACADLDARINRLQHNLDRIAGALWDRGLNARSNKMLREYFYDTMKLKEIITSKKGVKKVSLDRPALERLAEHYLYARPVVAHILAIRDLSKQLEVLETQVDTDNRFRSSYSIAGTETGRPSSSESAFGTGSNMQNIAPGLRHVFVADPGYQLFVIDFEQSEARDVGFIIGSLFSDWSYLDACECLTEDHEVLTPDGWCYIARMPDKIAVWNEEGQIYFEEPSKWNSDETNNLISIESRSVSLLGTANHSMPVRNWRSGKIEKRTLLQIAESPNFTAPNTGIFTGGSKYVFDTALIAAFQADGTRDEFGKVHWSFTKNRKINTMRRLLNQLEYEYSEYKLRSGATRFYLHTGQGQDIWSKNCNEEILTWDYKSLQAFCDSHYLWDAHITENVTTIDSSSRSHLEWLGTAYVLTGKSISINPSKNIYWRLSIKTNENHQYRSAVIKKISLANSTKVFCPTVNAGFFLVRRNRKIFISGNSGDLHTANAKLVWPELKWTGNLEDDKKIASQLFYRDFSYRDMAKRGSHLTNYAGTAFTMARHLKIPQKVADEFQSRYCRGGNAAFPSIPLYWQWAIEQIQTTYKIVTPFGRERHFFGNTRDDATAREAIAFVPQSTTSDRTNLGFWRTWKHLPEVKLLAQGYDSITFEVKEDSNTKDIVREVARLLQTSLTDPRSGRSYSVPVDVKAGYNWGYSNASNPRGLKKYSLD